MLYYPDYAKVIPSQRYLGYGFLKAKKVKILFAKLNDFLWVPANYLGLEKVPVKINGVYKTYRFEKKPNKLIGYKYFLLNKENTPISSLYYFRESKVESKLELNYDSSAHIIIFDNSLPKIKELFRPSIEPKTLRENPKIVSKKQIEVFESKNQAELKKLYNSYDTALKKIKRIPNKTYTNNIRVTIL